MKNKRFKYGASLVEIVVAVGVVGILATALATGITRAMKNTQNTRMRSLGNKYMQESLEYARLARDLNWQTFMTLDNAGVGPTYYCVGKDISGFLDADGNLTVNSTSDLDNCSGNIDLNPNIFTRYVEFTWQPDGYDPVDKMLVRSVVKWSEGSSDLNRISQADLYLTKWR